MADARLICPKRGEPNGHQAQAKAKLQVWASGLGLNCPVCGHRGRVAEFYVKSVSIDATSAGASAGGEVPG